MALGQKELLAAKNTKKNTPFGAEQKHDSSLSTVRKSVHDILQRLQFDMCFFVEKEDWLVNCKFATRTKALTHINKQRNFAKSTVNARAQGTLYHKAGSTT